MYWYIGGDGDGATGDDGRGMRDDSGTGGGVGRGVCGLF